MTTERRAHPAQLGPARDRIRWVASVALFAPLLLLLVSAVRTWRAEQRYAAVTHKVTHDYAGIAAWQYARTANMALHDEAMRAFSGIAKGHQRSSHDDVLQSPDMILAARATAGSILLDSARFAFKYDAQTRSLVSAGGTMDDATREMLERRLAQIARTTRTDDEPHRVLFDSAGLESHAIALWTIGAPDGPIRSAYGVVSHPRALRRRLGAVIEKANLFPAARLSAPLDTSDIAIRLTRRDGGVVFASALAPGATAATDSSTLQSGELRTTIDLSPRLASAFLVGSGPASQLPSLALMIVIATVLAGIGLVHERRTRELARVRARFVANVSHELRTPLAQISMFAETLHLGRERSSAEGRHFAAIILAEARRLTNLVDGVLRDSRHERRPPTLQPELVDVTQEIAGSVDAFAPIARAAEVTVTATGTEAWANVERAALRQIVLNLLDNAVKHGGRGSTIDVRIRPEGTELRLEIDDTGPGI